MIYYQLEFLWDKKPDMMLDHEGFIVKFGIEDAPLHWQVAGTMEGSGKIYSRKEAIMKAEKVVQNDIRDGVDSPWRVVMVTPTERKVIWIDPRVRGER